MNYRIKRIVYLGLLIALEIVLSRFISIATPFVKISLAFLPIAIAGILYGPVWAGAAGAMADFIGALLFPIGAFFPGFTLTAFLRGVTYGSLLYGGKKGRKTRLAPINASAAIVCLLLNMGLDTFWLYCIMGSGVAAYIPTRALTNGVMVVVQSILILLFLSLGAPLIQGVENDYIDSLRRRARGVFAGESGGEYRPAVSEHVTERVFAQPRYHSANTIFCYVGTAGELDTTAILADILATGKRLCVPLTEGDGVMTARRIHALDELSETGAFGIREPRADSEIVPPEEIDLALVPCSAADRRCNRVGKGGGYYDRYLAGTAMFKIALCPEELLVRRLPAKETDVPVDMIVTNMRQLGKG